MNVPVVFSFPDPSNHRVRADLGIREVSTSTRRCASPLTASSSSSGPLFPPQEHVAPLSWRYLDYPEVIDPEGLPIRPERHVGNSIATIRRVIDRAIARTHPMPMLPAANKS
jgi:hypothetical protein